jgi:hypothetical protein
VVTLPKVSFAFVGHIVATLSPTSSAKIVMHVKWCHQHMPATLGASMRLTHCWYVYLYGKFTRIFGR